jgi:hypothetical protein
VDLRLALGSLAQPFAVRLGDRLDANDPAFEWGVWTEALQGDASMTGTFSLPAQA